MKVVHTIHIDAPVDRVWSVTTDVERWPDWTPTVTSVVLVDKGVLALGSRARIKQPLQREAEWQVTEFTQGRRFAWQTVRAGMRMIGTHHMAEEQGGTRNVLTIEATGPVAFITWPLLRFAVQQTLSRENEGLKRHCEEARFFSVIV